MAAKPWEQRENESGVAFEAFTAYITIEPAQRSLAMVGRKLGKSTTMMERWSSQHEWMDRTRAYDADVQRRALMDEQRNAVRRQRNMLVRHRRLGRLAIEIATKMLVERAAEIGPAQLYQLMRGGMMLEASAVAGPSVKVAMSGDLVPLASDDSRSEQKPGEQTTMAAVMPKIEFEIMAPGGGALTPDALVRALAGWYDKPGETD